MSETGTRLANRVAIVTGAAHGIGKAYVQGMAKEGAKVVVADIDRDNAVAVAREIEVQGGQALPVGVDVSRWASVEGMVARTLERFGRVDILVNNAAMLGQVPVSRVPFWEVSEEEWDRVMAVNLKGAFLCARAVFPHMKSQGKGRIINISSLTVWIAPANMAHYAASKAGVIGLTRTMARALGEFNITVNCVAPGGTTTEALPERPETVSQRCIKRQEYPEDLVGTVVFLASDDAAFITGQTIVVDGGRIMH